MLIGLPASGKSTQAALFPDYVRLSTDQIVEDYAKSVGKTYNEVFYEVIKKATYTMDRQFEESLKLGENIILDRTNLTIKGRHKFLIKVPEDYKKTAIIMSCNDELTRTRNEERAEYGRNIPESVLKSMAHSMVYPRISEGFNEVFHVFGE